MRLSAPPLLLCAVCIQHGYKAALYLLRMGANVGVAGMAVAIMQIKAVQHKSRTKREERHSYTLERDWADGTRPWPCLRGERANSLSVRHR